MENQPKGPAGTYYGVPYPEQAEIFLAHARQFTGSDAEAIVSALTGIGFALLAIEHRLTGDG